MEESKLEQEISKIVFKYVDIHLKTYHSISYVPRPDRSDEIFSAQDEIDLKKNDKKECWLNVREFMDKFFEG